MPPARTASTIRLVSAPLPPPGAFAEDTESASRNSMRFQDLAVLPPTFCAGAMSHACMTALRSIVEGLVDLLSAGDRLPHWYTPADLLGDPQTQEYCPHGNLNFGLAHGVPAPLATAFPGPHGRRLVPGLAETIARTADWLCENRFDDRWGINWPAILPLIQTDSANGGGLEARQRAKGAGWAEPLRLVLRKSGHCESALAGRGRARSRRLSRPCGFRDESGFPQTDCSSAHRLSDALSRRRRSAGDRAEILA